MQGWCGCPGTQCGPGWGVTVRLSLQLSVYQLAEPCVTPK